MSLLRPEQGGNRFDTSCKSDDFAPARPDLIPLLDVIFSVLACFAFMLVMSELKPSSLPVNLPTVNAEGAGPAPEKPALEISFNAAEQVMFDGKVVSMEQLETVLVEAIQSDAERTIRLRGDREATHGLTSMILAAVTAAGAQHVEIAIQPRNSEGF